MLCEGVIRLKNSDINTSFESHLSTENMYDQQLVKALAGYIQNELQSAACYEAVSKLAPTVQEKTILLAFSQEEAAHAASFQTAYHLITGKVYRAEPLEPLLWDDYEQALQEQIFRSTQAYQQYGDQYLKAPTRYLQDLFFYTRMIEAQHAMRIPFLMKQAV